MIPVLGFRMALVYSLIDVSDKGYTMLRLGVSIMLTSLLKIIVYTASALNHVGYMCVLGCHFQLSFWIGGLISSRTSSAIVSSTALQVSTLGGGFLTLGSLVVLGVADVGSAVVVVVASENIVDSSMSDVKVLSLQGELFFVGYGCFNASDNSNAALAAVFYDYNFGILYCFGKNSTVSHTRVDDFSECVLSSTCIDAVMTQYTTLLFHGFPRCYAYLGVKNIQLWFQVAPMGFCCNQISH